MEDRLRLAGTPGQRLDAIREHRNRMAMLEQVMGRYAAAGQARASDGLKGKYYRLEAHQFLAEAGGDPEKEPPVVRRREGCGAPTAASRCAGPGCTAVSESRSSGDQVLGHRRLVGR